MDKQQTLIVDMLSKELKTARNAIEAQYNALGHVGTSGSKAAQYDLAGAISCIETALGKIEGMFE